MLGFPAKHRECLVGIGVILRQIPCTARTVHMVDLDVIHALKRLHNIRHAVRNARSEIENLHAVMLQNIVNCLHMANCKIHHMDVISAASTVLCGIVVAENSQAFALARRNLRHIGHQIVRDALRVFSDASGRVRANRVEIAQQHNRKRRVSLCRILKNLLHHRLCPAVGIRADAARHRFEIRNRILLAVYCCT